MASPPYQVRITLSAQKQLDRLPTRQQDRIRGAISSLADEPRPRGSRKLKGMPVDTWRIRVGNYRVLYEVYDAQLLVVVVEISDRKDVYRP